MSVVLRPVTRDDVGPLVGMEVAPDQAGFVATNAVSLAQAPYETGAYPFVIWHGGRRVGFLMAIDCREHAHLEEGDDPEAAFLWRLMIAAADQGRGYGRAALGRLLDWARDRGCPRIVTTATEANARALAFYGRQGFVPTGRILDGEVELTRLV